MAETREVDPYEMNTLFDYVDAMVRSHWPSDEIALTLLALGYQPPSRCVECGCQEMLIEGGGHGRHCSHYKTLEGAPE